MLSVKYSKVLKNEQNTNSNILMVTFTVYSLNLLIYYKKTPQSAVDAIESQHLIYLG